MCDARYNFIMVDVGSKGRQSDGGVFKNSNFYERLGNEELNLPPPSPLYPTGASVPQVCLTDAAFPLGRHGLRPFAGAGTGALPVAKNVFNYRLSRSRRTIENNFGIMAARWRIFRGEIVVELYMTKLIVQAAVCLHNFVKKHENDLPEDVQYYCPPNFGDRLEQGELIRGEWRREVGKHAFKTARLPLRENLSASEIRNHFMHYFMGPGKVPWQDKAVAGGYI